MPSRELQRSQLLPSLPWQWRRKSQGETQSSPPAGIRWYLSLFLWYSLLGLGVGELLLITIQGVHGANDFCQDYASAVSVLHGHAAYPPVFCNNIASRLPGGLEYNSHPPTSIVLFLPFGLLPRILAMIVWGLLSLGAYLSSIWLLLRSLGWPVLAGLAVVVFGSMFWAPSIYATEVLNFQQVLLLLLVGFWLLSERRQETGAGVLLGIACLLKIWPVLFVLVPLLQRRWRLVLVTGGVIVVGLVLALVVEGPSAFAAYLGPVRIAEANWVALASGRNISLTGAVVGLIRGYSTMGTRSAPLWPGIPTGVAVLLGEVLSVGLLLGSAYLLWWQRRSLQGESGNRLALGLLVTLILVTFPLSWPWGIICLFLPVALLVLALRRQASPPGWWWWLLGTGMVLLNIAYVPFVASLPGLSLQLLQHLWPNAVAISQLDTVEGTFPTLGVLLFAATQALLLIQQSGGHRQLIRQDTAATFLDQKES
jgi:Glycosyltransferase family 87